MKKKILTIIITILILVYFSINVFSENEIANNEVISNVLENVENSMTLEEQKQEVENKLAESSNRLEYVQGELTTSVQKIQELDDQINEYQKQYEELRQQVQSMESQISQTEQNIQTIENAYNRKNEILKKRVVALYEAGDTTYLDVLLHSSSLIDFLSNYFLLEQIVEFDTNMLDELAEQKQTIEEKKKEQEKQKQI